MNAWGAWMAFVTILGIAAIVIVAGGIVAFLGHMIIGVFDNSRKEPKEDAQEQKNVVTYNEYKQLENGTKQEAESDYDFEAINKAKAEEEAKLAGQEDEDDFDLLEAQTDEDLDKIENELKEKSESEEDNSNQEDEDIDLDSLLDQISDEVVEEENTTDEPATMSEELQSYSIDDLLNQAENEPAEEENENLAETETAIETEQPAEEVEQPVGETVAEPVEEVKAEETAEVNQSEVDELKAQLAEVNRQLNEARNARATVVTIDMTEEDCVNRLETLEERLKNAKRNFRINQREYRPLKKMMGEMERNQNKLRRMETNIAKQKIALYGVDNYVDIDKEKAQKLSDELELYAGLKLSVQHCEEVINANKDRYPVLEHTNKILEEQIADLEADIETTTLKLQKIREKNGSGEEGKK